MRRALGSNRAGYGRRQYLRRQIRLAASALGEAAPAGLERMRVRELEELLHAVYGRAVAAGKIRKREA